MLTLRCVHVPVCVHKPACASLCVCVCLLNGIFSLVKFLSNYVAKFTSISQSIVWFHSQPWASLM